MCLEIMLDIGQEPGRFIEILRETPSFRAGRKGGGPCGATAEPSGGVEAPAFRPGRTSTPFGMALIPTHLRTADIRAGAGIPVLNPAEIGIRTAEVIMAALQ